MIIERIDLKAYGRFTDRSLHLDAQPRRFFLIVGANESGKSTSLRAIGDWLFGFPTTTQDDYVHSMNKLRVGGKLVELRSGRTLDCLRRKGNKATLLASDNVTTLPDEALQPFLDSLSRIAFEQQFGISHQQLVEGGQQVIAGDGDLGELLFSAGAGVGRLRKLKEQLERDTRALLGERANASSRLGKATDELRELTNELKQASTPQIAFDNLQRERTETLKQAEQYREQHRHLLQRIAKLKSIQLALPLFAQRDRLDDELMAYAEVLPLMPGFSEQRSQAESELTNASIELGRRQREVEILQESIAAAVVSLDLLEFQEEIAALYRDVGHYEGQQLQLAQYQTELKRCNEEIQRLTRELQLDSQSLFTVDISMTNRRALQSLAKSHSGIVSKAKDAKQAAERAEADFLRASEEIKSLRTPPVSAALGHSLRSVGNPQVVLTARDQIQNKAVAARERLGILCRQLAGFEGDLAEVVTLRLPSERDIREAEVNLETAQQKCERLKENRAALEAKAQDLQQQLSAISDSHGMADLSHFDDALAQRERWLAEVLRASSELQAVAVQTVVNLQKAISEVDRLYKVQLEHRDQVIRKSHVEADLQSTDRTYQQCLIEIDHWEKVVATSWSNWELLWQKSGLIASDPPSMREWIAQYQVILDGWQQLQQIHQQLDDANAAIHHSRSELIAALQSVGDEEDVSALNLCQVHARALQRDVALQAEAADYQQRHQELAMLSKQLHERRADWNASECDLKDWQASWEQVINESVLHSQVTPQSIDDLLRDYDRLAAARDEASSLETSITSIRDYGQHYLERTVRVAKGCERQLAGELQVVTNRNVIEVVSELQRKAQQAKGQQDVASEKRNLLGEVERLIGDYQSKMEIAEATLARLCSEANCETKEELVEYERRSLHKSALLARLSAVEDQLQTLAPGQLLESFKEECEAVAAEDIDMLLGQLQSALDLTESAMSESQQALGRLDAELKQIGSSSKAVDLRQEIQACLAKMRRDADQFGKLVVARELLDRSIKRYQEQNQKNVLGLAGTYFSQLTDGRYHSLKVDFDGNQPSLLAVTDEGVVPIPQLSDGTADALYLSFRLASLDLHLRDHEPFPLIVDDCLIQFDDRRAGAALELLSDLSLRTQVIMFTHHEHLVQLANRQLPDGHYHVVRLDTEN